MFAKDSSASESVEPASYFSDMRKFRIVHLLWMSLSIAVASAVFRWNAPIGVCLLILVTLFWFGCGLLLLSDTLDNRAIEDRGIVAQTLNAFGATMVGFSVSVGLALSLFSALMGLIYFPSLWLNLAN